MAEEKRDQPREADRPQSGPDSSGQDSGRSQQGLARTGQGADRSQQGLARTGQDSGRPGRESDRPRSGQSRPLLSSIPPPRGLDPALRESLQSQREPGQARQESDQPRSGSDRPRQGSGRPQREPDRQSNARKPARRQRSTKARMALAFLYVLFVIGASVILATLGWVWACDLLGLNKDYASTEITIADDTDFSAVVDQLEKEGLIQYKFLFKLYAWFSHAEDKIVPGTYKLDTEMDYHALVSNLGSSSTTRQETNVTIPEGYTVDQIFSLLEEQGVSTVEKLRDMAANWNYAFDWLQDIPLGDYRRLEGYLFPDTYTFEMGGNPKYVINKMLVNFDDKMEEYMSRYTGEEAEYSLHDIVIIASMIEKETDGTVSDERNDYRSIASVIYNRLENPDAETSGYLQLDATLVYINGGRVPTEADKSINSPYNTYLHDGLPAGPISNPGMTSLLAAMEPAKTGYYFYVSNPETGQHEYSRTYAEHQRLLSLYYGDE